MLISIKKRNITLNFHKRLNVTNLTGELCKIGNDRIIRIVENIIINWLIRVSINNLLIILFMMRTRLFSRIYAIISVKNITWAKDSEKWIKILKIDGCTNNFVVDCIYSRIINILQSICTNQELSGSLFEVKKVLRTCSKFTLRPKYIFTIYALPTYCHAITFHWIH